MSPLQHESAALPAGAESLAASPLLQNFRASHLDTEGEPPSEPQAEDCPLSPRLWQWGLRGREKEACAVSKRLTSDKKKYHSQKVRPLRRSLPHNRDSPSPTCMSRTCLSRGGLHRAPAHRPPQHPTSSAEGPLHPRPPQWTPVGGRPG